jgi:hypothetical protein
MKTRSEVRSVCKQNEGVPVCENNFLGFAVLHL